MQAHGVRSSGTPCLLERPRAMADALLCHCTAMSAYSSSSKYRSRIKRSSLLESFLSADSIKTRSWWSSSKEPSEGSARFGDGRSVRAPWRGCRVNPACRTREQGVEGT